MRDATRQEQDSINAYLDRISIETGVNFLDILENSGEEAESKLKGMEENDDYSGSA